MRNNKPRTTLTGITGILLAVFIVAGCATTPKDVHVWGADGNFDRIRQELRQNPREDIRVAAAMELGKGNHVWGIKDLVTLSKDPSAKVRLAAVEGLGNYAGREVYNAIIQRTGDTSKLVARTAENILRTWGQETVEVLLEGLEDRNYKVRAASTMVLARMKDGRIAPALMQRLKLDDNSVVRREAAKALGNMGYAPAKPLLFQVKNKDASSEVAMEAEKALAKIGGPVTDLVIAVVPAFSSDGADNAIGKKITDALNAKLVKKQIGNIVRVFNFDVLGGDMVSMAMDAAQKVQAQQVMYARVKQQANMLEITLYRVDVNSGNVLQQEQKKGYESKAEGLIDSLVSLFISRFS